MSYLDDNAAYWAGGYDAAENVESHVFRFYGRILKHDLGITGGRLLDFGCGAGAALAFFRGKGFDVYGVDPSAACIETARTRFSWLSDRVKVIDPKPVAAPFFPSPDSEKQTFLPFDVVIAVQSLCLLSPADLDVATKNLYAHLGKGGVIYATMMSDKHWYYEHSRDSGNGMRVVNIATKRITVRDYHVTFTYSPGHMRERFAAFEPLHVGYYAAKVRDDEGQYHYYTFVGRKRC